MPSPSFPEPPDAVPATPRADLDAKLERLATRKKEWLGVSLAARIGFLRRCLDGIVAVSERWVAAGCRIKGISPSETLAGEEWLAGPVATARNVRLLIEALEQQGRPRVPKMTTRRDGQTVARVFPQSMQDRAMFGGFTADVWIERGKSPTQGAIYSGPPTGLGKVALVLGAGNVSSIAPMDAIYKLFVENEVVLLKMNPVNESIGPLLEKALRSLVDDGFLAFAYGGAEVGAYLADHPSVDTLHVTGSDRTYDAIVWGADAAEQERRKKANDPKNRRPFTAELGCVTPVLVVPGPWSASDMEFQARHVASMVAQNASFNCNAAKVLVTAKGWLQRTRFLELVDDALKRTPPRKAYYPGAEKRYEAFVAKYPQARAVGARGEHVVPWTVIPDVASTEGEYALTNEAFCGVLAEVSLDADDAPSFLRAAVDFANDRCWGTLSCAVFVHPATERDHADAVDDAIARLRYGGIGVNCWPAIVYALGVTTWGAFPGHPPTDIRSGAGVVHNALLFDHPEKSVVRAPFRIRPTPAWFADHKNLAEVGQRLLAQEAHPSWGGVMRVAGAAIKG